MVHIFSDLDWSLVFATCNMAVALVLGAIIGSERQFRGRMAGLRTNALVSLGAAGFVIFAALFPDDINPTRVAAQVVSGIGFLGAGIIFRDGFNIQGINTAATLWCSAAVGLIAGTGHLLYAVSLTSLIVFSNLGLRPIVKRLKRAALKNEGAEELFDLKVECNPEHEKEVRAVILSSIGQHGLNLFSIKSRTGARTVEIITQVAGREAVLAKVERTLSQISLLPSILRASYCANDDSDV